MKRAIVLAGGGAKGAYQFGFWRAIRELGIDFQIVTGSSVGALNGALFASGLYDSGTEMWNSITTEDIVETTPSRISQMVDTEGIVASLKNIFGDLSESAVNIKMDPFPLGKLISKYLDEKLLRESEVDFGLMVSEYPSMRAKAVRISEIPYGMLRDYLLASSTVYPSMDPKDIAGNKYVDGGYSDNFPVNLALDMGAEDIIGVNLQASGLEAKYETDYPVRIIRCHFDLGPTMEFIPEIAKRNLALGYNDTMRSFGKLDGTAYAFEKGEGEKMQKEFEKFCVEMLIKSGAVGISEKSEYSRSLAVKGFCEKRRHRIGLMNRDLAMICCETAAEFFCIDPTPIYTASEMQKKILSAETPFEENENSPTATVFASAKPLNYKLGQLSELDKKDVIAFFVRLFDELKTSETQSRDLRSICRFMPLEFFSALYISFLKTKEI